MIYPGLKIGDFVIEDELGRGGFGSVYLAKNVTFDKYVAIKFLHPKTVKSPKAKQAFLDEMINQARLSLNPNIVQIERSINYKDRHGEHLGMVMEFVDGEPLDLYIQKYTLLPEFVAIPIFIQVLNGISFAHQNNMLHRDIKPGNIIIGSDGVVKIMDFGLAKVISSSSAASESARAASLNYVAPERLDKGRIDARTDIYSLGATFYEALTGEPPYKIEFGEWEDARKLHSSGNFRSIIQFYEGHSVALNNFIKVSLAPNPDNRYSSCEEMKNGLIKIWEKSTIPDSIKPEFRVVTSVTKAILKGTFIENTTSTPSFKTQSLITEENKRERELEEKKIREELQLRIKIEEKRKREEEDEKKREIEKTKKKKEAKIKAEHLIRIGNYDEAVNVIKSNFDFTDEFLKKWLSKAKNWGKMSKDIQKFSDKDNYDSALNLMKTLFAEISAGEGKQQLLLKINELEEGREKEIRKLNAQLKESIELTDRAKLLEKLIKISPLDKIAELITKKEKLQKKINKKRKNIITISLIIGVVIITSILYLFVIKPKMDYNKTIASIKRKFQTNPEQALKMAQVLQKKEDNRLVRELIDKARYNSKINQGKIQLKEVEFEINNNNYDKANFLMSKIKNEIFKGISIPQNIRDKGKELLKKASSYYLSKAKNEKDKGIAFLFYTKAFNFDKDNYLVKEVLKNFLGENRIKIRNSLILIASKENNCKKAKYIINLCFKKVDSRNETVVNLREKIFIRCK